TLSLSQSLRPPTSPLFPYTTLFRSVNGAIGSSTSLNSRLALNGLSVTTISAWPSAAAALLPALESNSGSVFSRIAALSTPSRGRSEEHTSELQSRENRVCRLLLEKK